MTVFYPDVSNNNWGGSTQNALAFCAQLLPQGFSGVCHKMSEGSYYEDPFGPVVANTCAQNGIPFIGYHYVTTDNPTQQAQTWLAAGGGKSAMMDWEANGGNISNLFAVIAAFAAVGVTARLGYCPQWYWSSVGGGSLSAIPVLVSSAYPDGNGYASTIYAASSGDQGEGWASYGNATPQIWQFTDRALIGSITVDCNAFRGTAAQLAELFTGETPVTPTPSSNPPAIQKPPDEATQVSEEWDQMLIRWDMLAGHTPIEALALIGQALKIPGFSPPTQAELARMQPRTP